MKDNICLGKSILFISIAFPAIVLYSHYIKYLTLNNSSLFLPSYNDILLHRVAVEYTALHWNEINPIDFCLPVIGLGFPLFNHYQSLPHLIAAFIRKISMLISFGGYAFSVDLFAYLLQFLLPIAFYFILIKMKNNILASSLSSLFLSIVNDCPPPYDNNIKGPFQSYGIGWHSYLHIGHGLWTQQFGVFFMFFALGYGYSFISNVKDSFSFFKKASIVGLLLGCAMTSNLFYGYMAFASLGIASVIPLIAIDSYEISSLSRHIRRYILIITIAFLSTAYFVVYFLSSRDQVNDRERRQWKFDSMGFEWTFQQLISGNLLDYKNFSFLGIPLLTSFCALGTLVHSYRIMFDVKSRNFSAWVLLGALFHLFCFIGRDEYTSFLLSLLPFNKSLHFHRFIGGFQIFSLILAGSGAELLLYKFGDKENNKDEIRPFPMKILKVLCTILTLAAITQPLKQKYEMIALGNRMLDRDFDIFMEREKDYNELVSLLRSSPKGRVYAGFWGTHFHDPLLLYAILQESMFDMIGPTFHTMSEAGNWEKFFNWRSYDHLQLFNVRYLVLPLDDAGPLPPFVQRISEKSAFFQVFEVRNSNYFTFGRVEDSMIFEADYISPSFIGDRRDPWNMKTVKSNQSRPSLSVAESDLMIETWLTKGKGPAMNVFLSYPNQEIDNIKAFYKSTSASNSDLTSIATSYPFLPKGIIKEETIDFPGNIIKVKVETAGEIDVILKINHHTNWKCNLKYRRVMPNYMAFRLNEAGEHEITCEYHVPELKIALFCIPFILVIIVFMI